jgi:tRNA-uridine 2-sulfurtransferase
MRIAVAMSGGVDSSVAAALCVDKHGIENVFGVTMKLYCYGEDEGSEKSCCSLDAIVDAAVVCRQLGIRHYVVNLEKEFQKDVIDDFVSQYADGLTPNPCVRCNQLVKYEHLLRKAQELGAEKLVTGHYARISHDDPGYHLLRGLDPLKDQSYFLYNMTQEQLAHVEFPIGELTKPETREIARKYSLKTAEKTESQDICFVSTNVNDFLKDKVSSKPGNIVDAEGKVWGIHSGLHNYTIGQRKGLGGGFSDAMYVFALNNDKNEIVIGPEEDLLGDSLIVTSPYWVGNEPRLPFKCKAKIRYASDAAESTVSSYSSSNVEKLGQKSSRLDLNNKIVVVFNTPQKAITPGQSVVFYQEDEVIGGGVISYTGNN